MILHVLPKFVHTHQIVKAGKAPRFNNLPRKFFISHVRCPYDIVGLEWHTRSSFLSLYNHRVLAGAEEHLRADIRGQLGAAGGADRLQWHHLHRSLQWLQSGGHGGQVQTGVRKFRRIFDYWTGKRPAAEQWREVLNRGPRQRQQQKTLF